MDSGVPPTPPREYAVAGRIPLAVVVVDGDGLVSHWSTGAKRLFGPTREQAVGQPAVELLPVSGALAEDTEYQRYDDYGGLGPGLDASLNGLTSYPAAGRARLSEPGRDRVDVLWWAYPMVGPGHERLLVLAADAAQFGGEDESVERIAPGFALHTEFPGFEELARRLPEILPSMSVHQSTRIVSQILDLGYPVLEFSHHDRVPVTPDWGVPRRAERKARQRAAEEAAAAGQPVDTADLEQDLEYAAVRERLEFLNEVSGRIGSSSTSPVRSRKSARPSCRASPMSPAPICVNRSSRAKASRTDLRTPPPCGTASPSSMWTSRAAGTMWCRSANPCRSPSTPRSSSA